MDRPPRAIRHKPAVRQSLQTNLLERSKFPPPWPPGPLSGGASASKEPTLAGIEAQAQLNAMAVYRCTRTRWTTTDLVIATTALLARLRPPPAQFARGEFAPGGEAQV
jgi:hypothetical protein